MRKKWYIFIFIVCCFACTENKTEKHQGKRDNVVEVSEKLIKIELKDLLVNGGASPYIIGDYLVIKDSKSYDKLIHIFDKSSLGYISSAMQLGRGPGEITNIGQLQFDKTNNQLLVTDHTKYCVFAYNMDSLLSNPLHIPYIKARLDNKEFIDRNVYINDTLSYGKSIVPTSNSTFSEYMAKWNMKSGVIEKMPYDHPDIERKRISFAVSEKYGLYVECYNFRDLMTICSLDGELKHNIYGPKWDNQESGIVFYGYGVAFCGDKILALYSGTSDGASRSFIYPTKFLVFDIEGNYIKTLETGRNIIYFCYDDENDRVIMSLDDEMQFAYLDLNGLL